MPKNILKMLIFKTSARYFSSSWCLQQICCIWVNSPLLPWMWKHAMPTGHKSGETQTLWTNRFPVLKYGI